MIDGINVSEMGCMPEPCMTCPFAGTHPVQLGAERMQQVLQEILTFKRTHLCHSVDNRKACNGGRQLQVRLAFVRGLIDEPTNEAFEEALKKYGDGKPQHTTTNPKEE